MRKQYDQQLQKLHAELLHMGEMIQQAISGAVTALLEGDDSKAHEVIAFDGEIDQQERLIEQMCYKLLLSQQPVASDLRMVSSVLKMITDMERIGDHAADISELELMLEDLPPLSNDHLREMAAQTSVMLIRSIESFAEQDVQKAQWVIDQDDVVDGLFDRVRAQLISLLGADSANGGLYLDLLMIAKYFERIGDHATNIAEWVEFSLTGVHARQTDNKEIKQKEES